MKNDFERRQEEGLRQKTEDLKKFYKQEIFKLFSINKTPELITYKDLAPIFNIDINLPEKDLKIKVSNKLKIFGINGKEATLKFFYGQYLENNK